MVPLLMYISGRGSCKLLWNVSNPSLHPYINAHMISIVINIMCVVNNAVDTLEDSDTPRQHNNAITAMMDIVQAPISTYVFIYKG